MLLPKFKPGRIVMTLGAKLALTDPVDGLLSRESKGMLQRHLSGDWGECCPTDAAANDSALETGERILSAYHTAEGVKIWIITEAEVDEEHNRFATTILLPEEY